MSIQQRISDALENLLSEIYAEQNVQNGDISPDQQFEWDSITENASELFNQLINQNK